MNGNENRAAFARILMAMIERDRHPSPAQMEILENVIPAELVPDYLDILLEKVIDDRFPSVSMLRRIMRVANSIQ
jgi:hypothetical protein